jgi:hypothetical protein
MLEDLRAIAHLIDREEEGSFCLTQAGWSANEISLSLDVIQD